VRACNVVARSPAGQTAGPKRHPTEPTTRPHAPQLPPNSLPTGSARVRATSPGPASCAKANCHTYIGQRHPHGQTTPHHRQRPHARNPTPPPPPHSFLGRSCSCSRFRSPPNHGSRRRQVEPRAVQDAPEAPARGRGVPSLPTRPPIAPLRGRRPRVGVGVLLLPVLALALGGDRSALVVGPGAAPPPRKPRAAAAAPGGGDGERGGTGAGRGPPGGAAGEEGEEGQLLGAAAAAALPRWLAQERRRVLGGRRETERRGRGRRSVMLDQGATERPWRWTSASRCSVLCCSRVYAVSINLSVPWNGWPGIGETKGDLTARSFCKQTSLNEACTCIAPLIELIVHLFQAYGQLLINYWPPMQCKRVVNLFWQVVSGIL
jgi:hypothetical protein